MHKCLHCQRHLAIIENAHPQRMPICQFQTGSDEAELNHPSNKLCMQVCLKQSLPGTRGQGNT